MQIEVVRSAFSVGYTFRMLLKAIQEGHRILLLPPPPPPQPGDTRPRDCPSTLGQESEKKGPPVSEFSIATMHEYLVRFIVADDQVSTYYSVPRPCNVSDNFITVHECHRMS